MDVDTKGKKTYKIAKPLNKVSSNDGIRIYVKDFTTIVVEDGKFKVKESTDTKGKKDV
jgi:hypothetical protein